MSRTGGILCVAVSSLELLLDDLAAVLDVPAQWLRDGWNSNGAA
jgi:hypothetical protein